MDAALKKMFRDQIRLQCEQDQFHAEIDAACEHSQWGFMVDEIIDKPLTGIIDRIGIKKVEGAIRCLARLERRERLLRMIRRELANSGIEV